MSKFSLSPFSNQDDRHRREEVERGRAALEKARQALDHHDLDAALSLGHAALERFDRAHDREGMGRANEQIADALAQLGQFEAAARRYEQAAEHYESPADDAETFVKLGEARHYHGDLDRALSAYRHARDLYTRLGERDIALLVTTRIGYIHYQRADWVQAEHYYREALELAQKLELEDLVDTSQVNLGRALAQQGRVEEAKALLKQSEARARADDNVPVLAAALHSLAFTFVQDGQRERASQLFHESLRLQRRLRDKAATADILFDLGVNEGELGRGVGARVALEEAAGLYTELGRVEQLELTRHMLSTVAG